MINVYQTFLKMVLAVAETHMDTLYAPDITLQRAETVVNQVFLTLVNVPGGQPDIEHLLLNCRDDCLMRIEVAIEVWRSASTLERNVLNWIPTPHLLLEFVFGFPEAPYTKEEFEALLWAKIRSLEGQTLPTSYLIYREIGGGHWIVEYEQGRWKSKNKLPARGTSTMYFRKMAGLLDRDFVYRTNYDYRNGKIWWGKEDPTVREICAAVLKILFG